MRRGHAIRWHRDEGRVLLGGVLERPAAPEAAFREALVEERLEVDPPLTPLDEAVFLLHTAAEIEHALLAQYLYAAYSLDPEFAESTTWRTAILNTAREEMGHLITAQNLLLFVGGPLNFEREDFPFRTGLYPFSFELEPLSLDSLAKYILAEKPADVDETLLPRDLAAEIAERALKETQGEGVDRVGRLFAHLIALVASIPEDQFRSGRDALQATAEEWYQELAEIQRDAQGTITHVGPGLLILPVRTKQEALDALQAIAIQGEGASLLAENPNSHFRRFLDLYKAARGLTVRFALPVPTNPAASGAAGPSTLSYGPTRALGYLANTRYRLLLAMLHHLMLHPQGVAGSPRGMLLGWAYEEMASHLSRLAGLLTRLPRVRQGDRTEVGGVPFELPYTLDLPDLEPDRWRALGLLLRASEERIRALEEAPEFAALDHELGGELAAALADIRRGDAARADEIARRSRL